MKHRTTEDAGIRIALLFEFPTLNGGERSMLAVIDELHGGEFRFTAIAPDKGPLADALRERGIAVVPINIRDGSGRRLPLQSAVENLRASLQRCEADLVHANSLAMGRLTGALGDTFSIPRIAHLRDIIGLSNATVVDLNRNDRLIAVSAATRSFHVEQGLVPERVSVLYNGVDCDVFQPREQTGKLKRELKLPDNAFLVLTIGQIGLRKGHDVLAEAAIALKARRPRPAGSPGSRPGGLELHYLIVGERHSNKAESVEFERKLIERFAAAGLANRLHLLGYRDDVPFLMNEADLLVHPAHQEPFGRVLLEAAASGLPIVATSVGGTPEILTDGVSARLVPPGDPSKLAEAIEQLRRHPELRRQFADAARQRVTKDFPIGVAAQKLSTHWRQYGR